MNYYLISLFILLTPNAFATPFNICYESPHFFPYDHSGSKNQELSVVIKTINESSKNSGLEVKYIRASWARCLEDIKSNKVDALLTSLWTKQRDEIAVFPKTKEGKPDRDLYLLKAHYKIFTHVDSKLTWDGDKLSNLAEGIGAPDSYIASKKLLEMKALKTTDIILVDQAYDLITKRRLDGYVVLQEVGDIILKDYPKKELIKKLEKDFLTDYLYIPVSKGFNKNHPEITKTFFQELSKSRKKYMPNGLKKI